MTARTIAFAAAAVIAATAHVAVAQMYRTTPNIYGQPGYGTTTQGPGGTYRTTPNIYGNPGYGSTTTGPGVNCRTMPNIYGQPQFGSTTTCN